MMNRAQKRTWFDYLNAAFMVIVIFITVYPFWHQVVISLDGGYSVYESGLKLWPGDFSLQAYRIIIDYKPLWIGFRNSLIRVVAGVLFSVTITVITAYPLSKPDLPFNKFYTGFLFVTMLVGGGMIPNYILIQKLKLQNTLWAVILPGMLGAYNVFVVRNFFKGLPEGVEESALIDGANWLDILVRIVIPMSMPVIAVITLWTVVGHWNAWFDAMLYLQKPSQVTLPLVLRRILIEDTDQGFQKLTAKALEDTQVQGKSVEAATLIVSLIPMLVFYPFLQKYFVTGIHIGSIKG